MIPCISAHSLIHLAVTAPQVSPCGRGPGTQDARAHLDSFLPHTTAHMHVSCHLRHSGLTPARSAARPTPASGGHQWGAGVPYGGAGVWGEAPRQICGGHSTGQLENRSQRRDEAAVTHFGAARVRCERVPAPPHGPMPAQSPRQICALRQRRACTSRLASKVIAAGPCAKLCLLCYLWTAWPLHEPRHAPNRRPTCAAGSLEVQGGGRLAVAAGAAAERSCSYCSSDVPRGSSRGCSVRGGKPTSSGGSG